MMKKGGATVFVSTVCRCSCEPNWNSWRNLRPPDCPACWKLQGPSNNSGCSMSKRLAKTQMSIVI